MIREAQNKDFEQIYLLGEYLHPNYKVLYSFQDLIQEEYFHLLVYEANNKILGFLSYNDMGSTVDILDIVVDESYRRKHIALNLLDYMITNLNSNASIFLEVSKENVAAIKLYDKLGFETIHIRKSYYQGVDALVMERKNVNE